jgi:hypothetical protein
MDGSAKNQPHLEGLRARHWNGSTLANPRITTLVTHSYGLADIVPVPIDMPETTTGGER